MRTRSFRALIGASVTTIGIIATSGQANAFSLTGATLSVAMECNNDISTLVIDKTSKGVWQYNYDAAGDGSGGLHYEIYGMAFMQDAKYDYFAINAYDMHKDAGIDTVDANGKITKYNTGWGDLLISTQGQSIANNNGNIFGIHFGGNSGGVSQIGLYSNVTAKSVGKNHEGYDSISGVLQYGQKSKVISFDEYLKQTGLTETHTTASSQQNLSLSNYLKTLSAEDQQAYARKDWSFNTYLNNQTSTVRTAYNNASSQQNWSFERYLNRQPSAVRNAYRNGNQATRDGIIANYNQFIAQAKQTVSDTTNAYNLFKQEVQAKATEIQNAHEQFKQDAKNTIAQIRAPYDELAKNYQNTLFGELSNDQALSYFDKQGSNVIASGTWLAGIEMLNLQDLIDAGYDQDKFIGSETIAFRIARSQYYTPPTPPKYVPEPTAIFGLAAIGFGFTSGKLRKRHVLG